MALFILGKSQCPLCGRVLQKDAPLVVTSHFIADCRHPLWRFSDAAMHKSCFQAWPRRLEFIQTFNSYHDPHWRGMRFMLEDGSIEEQEAKDTNA